MLKIFVISIPEYLVDRADARAAGAGLDLDASSQMPLIGFATDWIFPWWPTAVVWSLHTYPTNQYITGDRPASTANPNFAGYIKCKHKARSL